MKTNRILTILSCSLIFLLFLTGCRKVVPYSEFITASSSKEINLSNGYGISIDLSSETNGHQFTIEHLITNSTKISVSCSSLPNDAEVLLTLYDESQGAPIRYLSLSSKDRSTAFLALDSVTPYSLIASVKNYTSEDSVLITVTD